MVLKISFSFLMACLTTAPLHAQDAPTAKRPNIVFILTDDHACAAMGTAKHDSPIALPHFNKLAREGMVFDRSYCANSLCGPSRASILTGRHSHRNGFVYNGQKAFDPKQPTYPKMLQAAGYQTCYLGKWHLESNPAGFDTWQIFPGQGSYYNPDFIVPNDNGKGTHREQVEGYATDVVTDKALDWLDKRDKTKPFLIVIGHKAPHRAWCPPIRHLGKVDASRLPLPPTLYDDYADRPEFLKKNQQTVARHMAIYSDLKVIKDMVPEGMRKDIVSQGYGWELGEINRMTPDDKKAWLDYYAKRTRDLVGGMESGKLKDDKAFTEWKWRAYMEDYLGCVKAVDDNVGRVIDYLDKNGLSRDTLVVYAGDQSFYLGEHGLYDKRWIFEESLRMPLIMKWPGRIAPGVRSRAIVQNIDYAPTFCTVAQAAQPANMQTFQGVDLTPLFASGKAPADWRKSIYYCFYENPGEHNCPRHDGIRNERYTLSYIWTSDEWMLFDMQKDPEQMKNVYADPAYRTVRDKLTREYNELRAFYKVPDGVPGGTGPIPNLDAAWD